MERHCRFAIFLVLIGIIGVHAKTRHQVASNSEQSQCPGSPAVDKKMVSDPKRGISSSSEKLSQEEDSTETLKAGESSNSKIDPSRSLPNGSQKQTRKNYPHEKLDTLRREAQAAAQQERQLERERAVRERARGAAMAAAARGGRNAQGRDRSPHRQGRK